MKNTSSARSRLITSPYIVWSALFIIAPLIFVVYYAFTDIDGNFTLSNVMTMNSYVDTITRSLWFGVVSTLICLVLAFPIAYVIAQSKANVQRTMVLLVMLPMWMNFLIRTYCWMILLQDTGIINSLLIKIGLDPVHMINTPGAVILGMVYDFLPYMILPIYSVMTKMDRTVIEAAQDLGGNKFTVMRKCIMPLSVPGVVSGITMVFVPSVSTFYISQKLGGGSFELIGDVIERLYLTPNQNNVGAALSMFLMILILVCMAVMNRFSNSSEEGMVL